jgi:hypothetical protein
MTLHVLRTASKAPQRPAPGREPRRRPLPAGSVASSAQARREEPRSNRPSRWDRRPGHDRDLNAETLSGYTRLAEATVAAEMVVAAIAATTGASHARLAGTAVDSSTVLNMRQQTSMIPANLRHLEKSEVSA